MSRPAVLARLDATAEGLSESEAIGRLERFGPNALRATAPVSAWEILLAQFRGVVVLLLLAAALVAWLVVATVVIGVGIWRGEPAVLALAEGTKGSVSEGYLRDLVLVGVVGMSDPPAPGVRETIERFQGAGIRIVMITGDQRLTAEAAARELGILRPADGVVEGHDLQRLSPGEMADRLSRASLLSRVSPED